MSKKLEERSAKSKEEFAKSLMSVANTIHGSAFVAILVLPLSAIISAYVSKGEPPISSLDQLNHFLNWLQIPLAVFLFAAVWFGEALKNKAMDLLDSLEKQGPTTRSSRRRR